MPISTCSWVYEDKQTDPSEKVNTITTAKTITRTATTNNNHIKITEPCHFNRPSQACVPVLRLNNKRNKKDKP